MTMELSASPWTDCEECPEQGLIHARSADRMTCHKRWSSIAAVCLAVGTCIGVAALLNRPVAGVQTGVDGLESKTATCTDVQKACTIAGKRCSSSEWTCYKHVMWAMEVGVQEHPEWYSGTSFEELQAQLAKKGSFSCPAACSSGTGETPAPAPLPASTAKGGETEQPCLCGFDIDRTLTAKQKDWSCPVIKKQKEYIWDDAYGGGRCKFGAVGAAGINNTACDKCYVAIVSRGNAAGPNSKMRQYILDNVIQSSTFKSWVDSNPGLKKEALQFDDWNVQVHSQATSPFITLCPDENKPDAVLRVLDWYKEHGVEIKKENTYFFDDNEHNIGYFRSRNIGVNTFEVSCKTRDGYTGKCGAELSEIRLEQVGTKGC